jgi:hypothetical protein
MIFFLQESKKKNWKKVKLCMNNENLLIFFIIIFWLIDVSIQPLILLV